MYYDWTAQLYLLCWDLPTLFGTLYTRKDCRLRTKLFFEETNLVPCRFTPLQAAVSKLRAWSGLCTRCLSFEQSFPMLQQRLLLSFPLSLSVTQLKVSRMVLNAHIERHCGNQRFLPQSMQIFLYFDLDPDNIQSLRQSNRTLGVSRRRIQCVDKGFLSSCKLWLWYSHLSVELRISSRCIC